jgi:crotonobetainyl-CoA:carnitine CoA-transferase CaiB-like acyl-CoA transferase
MAVIPLAQAVHHPQLEYRNFWHKFHDPSATGLPPFAVPMSPYRLSASPATIHHMPPRFGQHTDEILAEHGYSDSDIAHLRTNGTV